MALLDGHHKSVEHCEDDSKDNEICVVCDGEEGVDIFANFTMKGAAFQALVDEVLHDLNTVERGTTTIIPEVSKIPVPMHGAPNRPADVLLQRGVQEGLRENDLLRRPVRASPSDFQSDG